MEEFKKYSSTKILIFCISLLFIFYIKKKINKNKNSKVCICAIGKNENKYINEFVDYYKNLGFSHIFLYDNNDINDEKFEEILQKEIRNNFITIINYRGYRGKEQNPQIDAYKDCYEKYNRYYHWLSFFDIDEYLELNPLNLKIQDFLNSKRFNICQIIKINWLYYVNNNSLYYEEKSLQQRMIKPLFNLKINKHIKSIVRGNLSKNYWLKAKNPHTSINDYITCSSSGRIINSSLPFNIHIEHKYAYLKHYHMKSFEEYCLKIRRGRPIPKYKIYKEKMIDKLIKDNKNNIEKLNIINKVFNLNISKT